MANANSVNNIQENSANKDASGGYAGLTLFKINFKNAANTIISFFANANTVARTYTFQNRDGTISDDTDLALKAPIASPTFTGTVVLPSTTSIGTVSNTEIGYLDGVTSAIQTQLNAKVGYIGGILAGTSIATVTTRYWSVYAGAANSLEANANMQPSTSRNQSKMKLKLSIAQPATGSYVWTSRKNTGAGAQTVTITGGSAPGYFSDTTNSDSITSSDETCYQATNNALIASGTVSQIECQTS